MGSMRGPEVHEFGKIQFRDKAGVTEYIDEREEKV